MNVKLTSENGAALAKYAQLSGHTPAEFLNRYLTDNMIALFENPRSSELESHLATLEYRTGADAERVAALIEKRITERSAGRTQNLLTKAGESRFITLTTPKQ
jgi:hypothetical protein